MSEFEVALMTPSSIPTSSIYGGVTAPELLKCHIYQLPLPNNNIVHPEA